MEDFREFIARDLRLAILELLLGSPSYQANDSVLYSALTGMLGFPLTRDTLRTELSWLEEQGAVRLQAVSQTLIIARITERGTDYAQGIASNPNISRPRPK